VQNGDLITLDVAAHSLHLHVVAEEMERRRAAWVAPKPHAMRGWTKLYIDHVLQADKGVDLDFLVGRTGSPVPRDNH
jgi:dihydroxy-acid dehydratase